MTHNACVAYPEWLKDKKTTVVNTTDDELDNQAEAAAATIPKEELIGNEDEQENE